MISKILIATSNQGKVSELVDLLTPFNVELVSLNDYNLPAPEENGNSFEENSYIKAKYYSNNTGLIVLSDDSGICVESLNNQPGIYSADWAEHGKNYPGAAKRIEELLNQKNSTESKAFFVTALTVHWPDNSFKQYLGKAHGSLVFPARGNKGLGYDPIFIPTGHKLTFGEMPNELKNTLSARGKAIKQLIDDLFPV